MNSIDAEHFFNSQIKPRWPDWAETPTEQADWIRWLLFLTKAQAKEIIIRLVDSPKGGGKKPYKRKFLEIRDAVVGSETRQTYTDFHCYCVYIGGSGAIPYEAGYIKSFPVRCKGVIEKTDVKVLLAVNDKAKFLLAESFGDATAFEIYIDGWLSASNRSHDLYMQDPDRLKHHADWLEIVEGIKNKGKKTFTGALAEKFAPPPEVEKPESTVAELVAAVQDDGKDFNPDVDDGLAF